MERIAGDSQRDHPTVVEVRGRERHVRDRELAAFLSPVVAPKMIPVPAPVRAVNPLVARYWALVKKAL